MKKIVYTITISLILITLLIPTCFATSEYVLEKISGGILFDLVGNYNVDGNEQIIALLEDEDGEGGTFYILDKNRENIIN